MMLPIPNLSSLTFLSALTVDCDREVFAVDELGAILHELWEEEIKWIFIVDFLIYVVFFICWGILVTSVRATSFTKLSFVANRLPPHLTCFSRMNVRF
jgi:hypothetical protein